MKKIISVAISLAMLISMSTSFALPLSAEGISQTTSEAVTTAPEESPALPEATTTLPEAEDIMQGATEPAPEVTEPIPEVLEPVPEVTEPTPEVTDPTSEATGPEPVEDSSSEDLPLAAGDIVDSGYCGDTSNGGDGTNLTWTLDGAGTLTISGSGGMANFTLQWDPNPNVAPWNQYSHSIKNVVIGEGVTSIGNRAFENCMYITNVIIPNSITSIGERVFYNCAYIASITIPNSVISIGDYAFDTCTGLTSISIPNGVTRIDANMFNYCTALTSIDVDSGNPAYCSVDGVLFSKDKTEIVCYPAGKKNSLYIIPNGVTSIWGTFRNCNGLISITIPNSVTSIGSGSFCGCTGLVSIEVDSSNSSYCSIDGVLFTKDKTKLVCYPSGKNSTSYIIPDSVTSVDWYAFSYCTRLTSITIPNSVTSFGYNAFDGCSGLTSITIPSSVTSINGSAFQGCTGLTSITIPKSVTSVGFWVFNNCQSLTDIYCEVVSKPDGWDMSWQGMQNWGGTQATVHWGQNGPSSSEDIIASGFCGDTSNGGDGTNLTWTLDDAGTLTISGQGRMANYNGSWEQNPVLPPWTEKDIKNVVIEEGVATIGNYSFSSMLITGVTIPGSVTSIGDSAFNGTRLTSLTLPEGVTSIGSSAFSVCTGITSLTIPNSVTSIGSYAFNYCTGITSLAIPKSVTQIGATAFGGCKGLASITVDSENPAYCSVDGIVFSKDKTTIVCYPAGRKESSYVIPDCVTKIEGAFANCDGLISVTIPTSVITIGANAFTSCVGLTDITIPDSVTSIGSGAFMFCDNLAIVSMPNSVTSIGDSAFQSCTSLTSITIPGNITSIEICTFAGCTSLTDIKIPNSVTSIKPMAFSGCSGLTKIIIPNSVISIEPGAFNRCTSLESAYIPASVIQIDAPVFIFCDNLKAIYCEVEKKPDGWNNMWVDWGTDKDSLVQWGCKMPDENIIASGTCGEGDGKNLTWTFDNNGTLTISGNGRMDGYVPAAEDFAPWADYWKQIKKVVINDGVTSIGSYAFDYCPSIEEAIIADSVITIETHAFNDCRSLREIYIPKNVTSVRDAAFAYCYNLSTISVAPENKYYHVSGNCLIEIASKKLIASAVSCEIPDDGSVTSIGTYALAGNTSLTSIIIPSSVTSIADYAFSSCTKLTDITIPDSVTSIGWFTFNECSSLTDIYCEAESKPDGWADNWQGIQDYAANKKAAVYWGYKPLENIIASGFCGGEEGGKNLTWTLSVTGTLTISGKGIMIDFTITLPISTFAMTRAMTREAPELSAAPWSQYADKITNIVLDEGVTSIGSHAFDGCEEVKVVSIPKTIEVVGESAFDNCTSLKTIYCEAEKAPEGWDDSWQGVQDSETGEKAEVIWGKLEPKYEPGDVNGDGKLNNQDAIHLLKHVMNSAQYTINQSGDMNGDGKLNNQDAIYLLKHILNPSTYPLKNS